MSKKKTKSPAIQLLRIVWGWNSHQMGHSWERISSSMHRALALAIESGLRFNPDDLRLIADEFRPEYWCKWETMYALACCHPERRHGWGSRGHGQNRSACLSIEKMLNRKPFILKGHRLCVGAGVQIGGEQAYATSFGHADGEHWINVCSYHPYQQSKPDRPRHRFKITRVLLKEMNAMANNRKKAEANTGG